MVDYIINNNLEDSIMAVFKEINEAIKTLFPHLDIEAMRGEGYVYFDGEDGFDKIDSIFTNPTTTSTEELIKMCVSSIETVEELYL